MDWDNLFPEVESQLSKLGNISLSSFRTIQCLVPIIPPTRCFFFLPWVYYTLVCCFDWQQNITEKYQGHSLFLLIYSSFIQYNTTADSPHAFQSSHLSSHTDPLLMPPHILSLPTENSRLRRDMNQIWHKKIQDTTPHIKAGNSTPLTILGYESKVIDSVAGKPVSSAVHMLRLEEYKF